MQYSTWQSGAVSLAPKYTRHSFPEQNLGTGCWHTQLLTARNMRAGDVGIILSYSGQTHEMVSCAKAMRANGVKIISITRYGRSPVADLSDFNLYVSATEAIFRSGAMSSRISQLNIIDILYTGYLNTQYENAVEQIAKTHIKKGNGVDEDV